MVHPETLRAYYEYMQMAFDHPPPTPPNIATPLYTPAILCQNKVLLTEEEQVGLFDWARRVQPEAHALSTADSIRHFELDDNPHMNPILKRALEHLQIDIGHVNLPEPYMKHFLHYVFPYREEACPFVHDANFERDHINMRIYICLHKSPRYPLSGMLHTQDCIHEVDMGCMTSIHPAEHWYTFVKAPCDEDPTEEASVIWLTFGLCLPIDMVLDDDHLQSIESAKGRLVSESVSQSACVRIQKELLRRLEYTRVLPIQGWDANACLLMTSNTMDAVRQHVFGFLSNLFQENIKTHATPATIVQYNSIVFDYPLDELGALPQCVDLHKKISTHLLQSRDGWLQSARLLHITKGGCYTSDVGDAAIDANKKADTTILIPIVNGCPTTRMISRGKMYAFEEGRAYNIGKLAYGITTHMGSDACMVLQLLYCMY